MSAELRTVHRSALAAHSDEPHTAGHGGAAVSSPKFGDPASLSFPPSFLGRPSLDQRPRIAHTPSWVLFLKETLGFLLIQPTVLGVLLEYAFSFGKRSFFGLYEKYVFRLITELPL
jgi:hypothetical protein